jgi:hypothetical protein
MLEPDDRFHEHKERTRYRPIIELTDDYHRWAVRRGVAAFEESKRRGYPGFGGQEYVHEAVRRAESILGAYGQATAYQHDSVPLPPIEENYGKYDYKHYDVKTRAHRSMDLLVPKQQAESAPAVGRAYLLVLQMTEGKRFQIWGWILCNRFMEVATFMPDGFRKGGPCYFLNKHHGEFQDFPKIQRELFL